jgi:TatD DNase family protein
MSNKKRREIPRFETPIIETHCHLDYLDGDALDETLQKSFDVGIERIITIAVSASNLNRVMELTQYSPNIWGTQGIHPHEAESYTPEVDAIIRQHANNSRILAVGEIGLDYYRQYTPREIQMRSLEAQLELAAEVDLPVILHNRDSDDDLLSALKSSSLSSRNNPGVLHSFSTTWETAAAALDLGYYLGFSGPVTFKKSDDLREIVSKVPTDRIVVETDAPFLAPQKYRGKRNEPAYVSIIAETIASIRGVKLETFARQSTDNAVRLFGDRLL